MTITNTTQVKFYYGTKTAYLVESHGDGIYFAHDTKEIIVNDVSYGVSDEIVGKLNDIQQSVKDEEIRALAAEDVLKEAIEAEKARAIKKEGEIDTELTKKATKTELAQAKTELQGKIDGKANKTHTHNTADVTGLDEKLDELEAIQKSNKLTVAESDKVLKITTDPEKGEIISSDVTLAYDSTKGVLTLTGKDKAVISTINLGVHQIIETGKLETIEGKTYIVLKFIGVADEIRIDASTLIDIYTAGDGLSVTGNKFALKVENVAGGLKIVDGALTSTELRSAMDAKINKKADSTTLTTELAKKADKTALDAEVARATKKEGELDTAIKANTTAITAEETRANKVEGKLDAAVKAEVARATKREGELDAIIKQNTAKISAEEVRAKKVEDELKANKLNKSELNWRVVG